MKHAHDTHHEYRMAFVVQPEELKRVRRTVRAHLRIWRLDELIDDTLEIVTELLANVYRHAGGEAVLLLQGSPGLLHITVSDQSTRMPVVKEPDWASLTGRGMFLVNELADEWKAVPTATGKDIYVTLAASTDRSLRARAEPARCSV